MTDLSVVIVNWNTRDLLMHCLESLYDTVQAIEFEVFMVDNASSDGSPSMVRDRFSQVSLIENPTNVGFAAANNQAIIRSSGRYVLLLNSDAQVLGNALPQMVRFLDAHSDAGIVGPHLVFPDGRPQTAHGPLPTLASEIQGLLGLDRLLCRWNRRRDPTGTYAEAGYVSGACLMVRRQALEQVGLLDERFFMFGEEIDLCNRAHGAGWRVCHLPSAQVVHLGGGSTGRTGARVVRLYRGKLAYFRKHHGDLAGRILLFAMCLSTALKVAVYTTARFATGGRVRADVLWRSVWKGLELEELGNAHPAPDPSATLPAR